MIRILSILLITLLTSCNEGLYPDRYTSLCDATKQAKKQNKPLLIYYSLHGIGYDEFLIDFIGNKSIRKELAENFIVCDIKIDSKSKEIDNELQTSPMNCLGIQFDSDLTQGELNLEIQKKLSGKTKQPNYQILNTKLEKLIEGFGYTSRNISFFKRKLFESKENFENQITKEKHKEEIILAEYLGMLCDCPQWKLLKATKKETDKDQLTPIDTIEITTFNEDLANQIEFNEKNIFEFKGSFYKDEQKIKYEDDNKAFTVRTFVYTQVKNIE